MERPRSPTMEEEEIELEYKPSRMVTTSSTRSLDDDDLMVSRRRVPVVSIDTRKMQPNRVVTFDTTSSQDNDDQMVSRPRRDNDDRMVSRPRRDPSVSIDTRKIQPNRVVTFDPTSSQDNFGRMVSRPRREPSVSIETRKMQDEDESLVSSRRRPPVSIEAPRLQDEDESLVSSRRRPPVSIEASRLQENDDIMVSRPAEYYTHEVDAGLQEGVSAQEESQAEVQYITREEFEKGLNVTIDEGTVDDISEIITPYQLTKCDTNSLERSLEVSYKLRKRAKGPDAEDLKKMGASVEEFAFHLLDPLKKNKKRTSKLEGHNFNDFDRVIDKAVAFRQTKFLSHPVVYTLLMKRWKGKFYELPSKSPFKWYLLNLWTVFDVVFFLLVFPLLYLVHIIIRLANKEREEKKKDPFDYYFEYFTTPYFKFVRDTLSYLALLVLHFAVCLQLSSLRLNVWEWLIIVFFLGRLLMEIDQFISGMIREEKKSLNSSSRGSWSSQMTKSKMLAKMLSKYLGDWWNLLDVLSLVIFTVIIVLRLFTWSRNVSVSENRLLAVAAYLYGLNAIFLTLRVFGHIMESIKFTGPIQIALFHIIGAILAIFGQFFAAILAFSFAITKIYLASLSYKLTNNASSSGLCKPSDSGLSCWWNSVTHLTWSLLGIGDSETLRLEDGASELLARLLYGIFLILGVIMLMNMLIALLSNIYQHVEDNSFYEWSHKKATTIRTYCTYHPVPVPFNILTLFFKLIRYIYRKIRYNKDELKEMKRGNTFSRKKGSEQFEDLIVDLQKQYFSVYGYDFPKTDEEKLDQVMKETKGNYQLMGNIAYRVFEHNWEEKQYFGVTNEWQSKGIKVDGQRLTYIDCTCDNCETYGPSKYNGAKNLEQITREKPGFEVLIQECGELRFITVGIVGKNWNLHNIPGSHGNTVGYRIHEGKIFDGKNQDTGRYVKDYIAFRGDVIGCEISYEEESDDSIPVYFTLNGKSIVETSLITAGERHPYVFYPYVGIGFEGISLLFRMRSKEPVPCGLQETNEMVDASLQLNTEIITMRSHEMDVLTDLAHRSDAIFSQITNLRREVDVLRGEVQLSLKGQGSKSRGRTNST